MNCSDRMRQGLSGVCIEGKSHKFNTERVLIGIGVLISIFMSVKNSFLRQWGRGQKQAREKQTLSQGDELTKIFHVKGKRLRITINSVRKREFSFIFFNQYLFGTYISDTEVRGTKQNKIHYFCEAYIPKGRE